MKPTIRILHNLARSGGTIISRCLGSMDHICLLSEIHPLGRNNPHFSALHQYQEWYGDLIDIDWKEPSFLQSIALIHQRCEANGNTLVLRDWAHIDFFGPPALRPPSYEFLLDKKLSPHYSLNHTAVVRHPLEMWRSFRKLPLTKEHNITTEQYLSAYRQFLNAIEHFYIVRYEDFSQDPIASMQGISDALDIPFDEQFIERWYDNHAITGDIYNNSRASVKKEIVCFPLREIESEFISVATTNEDYQFIISKLGYPF